MKVTEQQPLTGASPEVGGTNAAAGTDSAGKLKTQSGELAVEVGAPDLIPRPEIRASNEPAPMAQDDFRPASAESLQQPAKASHAPAQGLRGVVGGSSPDHALHLRDGIRRARISEEPSSVVAQRDPSGSKSRVSGKSSELATRKLSQLADNKAFFERHGIRKPRSDIRIPLLNLTLARRDSDYKAMIARLDSTLRNYKQALAEATPVSAQTPEQRAKTMLELNAQLDRLERHVIAERQALSGADHQGRQQELLNALSEAVDDERAMLVDVMNAFNAGRPASGTSASWQNALEFKRVGLNLGDNVNIGESRWKAVQSSEEFGRGGFNTVQQLKFRDGSVGIFKPSAISERSNSRPAVCHYWDIPTEHPRYGARNVASANLDRQLGSGNVLVASEFFLHDGQLGILMEKAPGQSFHHCVLHGDNAAVARLADNPTLHRDLNKLQVMDALCGQLDRHLSNMFIELDADGRYQNLRGIDNDASFGQNEALNDLSQFSNAYNNMDLYFATSPGSAALAACNNVGLPPLVDSKLAEELLQPDFADRARANVKGLLSARETAGMNSRIEQLQAHVEALRAKGLTVTDWESGRADNGQSLTHILAEDKHHSYSQRFIDTAGDWENVRVLNNALGLK